MKRKTTKQLPLRITWQTVILIALLVDVLLFSSPKEEVVVFDKGYGVSMPTVQYPLEKYPQQIQEISGATSQSVHQGVAFLWIMRSLGDFGASGYSDINGMESDLS